MFEFPERVLILAPHTDDGEFGAGGTISLLLEQGCDVHYVAFSSCEDSVPDGWPSDVLVDEVREATAELGVPPANLRILDFPVRRFSEQRQAILQAMVDLDREMRPGLVLCPDRDDLHQDHQTVAIEALRAFKRTSILAYEIPWNNVQFQALAFFELKARHAEDKVRAIACYRSQQHRTYSSEEYLLAQLRYRGTQIGVQYAETFNVVRSVRRYT